MDNMGTSINSLWRVKCAAMKWRNRSVAELREDCGEASLQVSSPPEWINRGAHKTIEQIGVVNWLGLWTLYKREVWRFFKVFNQTIFAPVVTTLLFLAVLVLSMGGHKAETQGIEFERFIAPGLVMMAVVQNAFANTSSSLMLSKIQGVIIDILTPPLKGWEICLALTSGGITRGFLVGISVSIAVYLIVPFSLFSLPLALYYIIMSSMLLALLGILGGIMAQSFDQMAAFTNYVITPLSFLSGTFYSIKHLPEFWQHISHANPFFYMIDGFRYAMTGHADGNIQVGIIFMALANASLFAVVQHLFAKGWRLKN